MIRIMLASLALCICSCNVAFATSFAALLYFPSQGNATQLEVKNPLYTGGGHSGVNPLFDPEKFVFDPGQLWQGAPTEFRMTMDVDLPSGLPPAPEGAFVFGLSMTDLATGAAIHQLAQPVLITADTGGPVAGDFTFGTFDEATGQWAAISPATKKEDNLYCGITDHFSVFYIAPTPVPEPATCTLLIMAAATLGAYRWRRARK